MIRKYISIILTAIMLAVAVPMMTVAASAQTRNIDKKQSKLQKKAVKQYNRDQARYNETARYNEDYGYDDGYGYEDPNVYDRHRKAINIGGGAVAGAVLGALLGGKKGALIGAGVGAAGGYIATKVQKPRNTPRYY